MTLMAPTTEKPSQRIFNLRLGSETVQVTAGTICEEQDGYCVLKREGEIVGKFRQEDVSGWWVEESASNQSRVEVI